MHVIPSGGPLGAEIHDLDLSAGMEDATFAAILDAINTYSVICIRDQTLTVAQQRAFCARFGTPEAHPSRYVLPEHDDVLIISNIMGEDGKPIGVTDAGRLWHTDAHYEKRPSMYSALYALEIPHDEDGNPLGSTLFLSTAHAYETLPEATKERIAALKADNTIRQIRRKIDVLGYGKKRGPMTAKEEASIGTHPIVRTHPLTGRKSIYVSEGHTEHVHGLSDAEGEALIAELQRHCLSEDNIYRHRWQVGDLVMWDNCVTQHNAIGDYGPHQRRLLHRVSVQGEVPF